MPLAHDRDDSAGRTRLQHELKNPLAIILGRTYLLARMLREHPGLSASEQAWVLTTVQSIEQQVQTLTTRIDDVQNATYADGDADTT